MSSKSLQLLIITLSIGLIYFFYQLPTSVIENKNSKDEIQKAVSVEQALSLIAVSYTHLTLPTILLV